MGPKIPKSTCNMTTIVQIRARKDQKLIKLESITLWNIMVDESSCSELNQPPGVLNNPGSIAQNTRIMFGETETLFSSPKPYSREKLSPTIPGP